MTSPSVLAVLRSWEPSAPRLTWYGDGGERVELSGRVLTNWVVKAANLLVTECSAAPGTRVALDLPAHWRLLVWALGSWAVGAEVTVAGSDETLSTQSTAASSDVVITARPERWLEAGVDTVAVALPALARAWPDSLPPGVIDGAAELMGQPDEPVFAVAGALRPAHHGGHRLLLLAEDPRALLADAWSCWENGGAVVVATPRAQSELDTIAAQEHAAPGDRGQGTPA